MRVSRTVTYPCGRIGELQASGDAGSGRGLHRLNARLKLALLLLVVGLNVGLARLEISTVLLLAGFALVLWSQVPSRRFFIFFLAPLWATLMVFIGFSAGFGHTAFFSLGKVTFYREGILLGVSAAVRVACDMAWLAAVFLTTPFLEVLGALKWFRVPDVLVDVTAMAYRYAFLLHDEFHRMREAAYTRGGLRSFQAACRCVSMILSQIILRTWDRARRIHQSMIARGEGVLCAGREDVPPEGEKSMFCPNRCDITPLYPGEGVPVLSCDQVSHAYGKYRSIENISLSVSRGEVVVLCGPNGAGKTTLLRLAAGLLAPDRGRVLLSGMEMDRRLRPAAFRLVGLLAQDPNDQLFCTHVKEDVAYGPTNLGLPREEIERRVETAMQLMEVGHLSERPIHTLSHGEMKRVGLAGIIAMQPPLILLDEPTAGLDPASTNHLVRLLNHLNHHHGYTLMAVTHDIQLAARIARRIIILQDGKIRADGPAREILTDFRLLEEARLEPPILTRLFQRLAGDLHQKDRVPITIEEAVGFLKETVDGGRWTVGSRRWTVDGRR